MKTAAAFNSGAALPACQQDHADFQRRLRILEAVADRIPYTWYVYDVIADRCIWSGARRADEPASPEQVAQSDLHPDDCEVLADRRQRIAEMRDGEAIGTAYRVHAAGEWRWYYVRDSVLSRNEHGLPQLVLSLVEDFAERNTGALGLQEPCVAPPPAVAPLGELCEGRAHAEAECLAREIYQKVLDFVPMGVALFDRTGAGRLLWANRAYWRQLGQPQPADNFTAGLAVRHFADFFDVFDAAGEPLPAAGWPLARALRGEQFYGYEVGLRHRITGRQWLVIYDGIPFADTAGTRRLALLVLHPARAAWQPQHCAPAGEYAVSVVPAEFQADITDLSVPRLDIAALAREFRRDAAGIIKPESERPDALPGLQVVYVAGPGDSLDPDCRDF